MEFVHQTITTESIAENLAEHAVKWFFPLSSYFTQCFIQYFSNIGRYFLLIDFFQIITSGRKVLRVKLGSLKMKLNVRMQLNHLGLR